MSLEIALSGHWLLGLFSRDDDIVALGSLLLWVDVLVQPAKAANIAITFSLRAAGDSRFPAVVGSTLMWTVGLGSALADEWTRAVVNGLRWRSGAWKSKGVM
jgi:Na+-driven multidrug efflux pump